MIENGKTSRDTEQNIEDSEQNIEDSEQNIEDSEQNIDERKMSTIPVDIGIILDKGTDLEKAKIRMEKIFKVANMVTNIFFKEEISTGEGLLLTYILEKGILSTFSEKAVDNEIYKLLMEDNKLRLNTVAGPIIKSSIERLETKKKENEKD